jgi:hypothetical protein
MGDWVDAKLVSACRVDDDSGVGSVPLVDLSTQNPSMRMG